MGSGHLWEKYEHWRRIAVALPVMLLLVAGLAAQVPSSAWQQAFAQIEDDSVRVDSMVNVAFDLAFKDASLSLDIGKEAVKQAKAAGLNELRVRALLTVGSTYHNQGIRDWAMDYFLQAMNYADSVGWIQGRAAAWNNIGSIQAEEENFKAALVSLRNARRDFLKIGSKFNASAALMNIGSVHLSLHELEAAKGATDSTLVEMEGLDDPQGLGIILCNLGQIYAEQKHFPEALQSMDRAIEKAVESADMYGLGEYYITRAAIRMEAQQLDSATRDVQRGLEMMQEFGALDMVVRGYSVMSSIAKAEGRPLDALEWLEKSVHLNDSLQSDERKTALANFQSLYEVERKDAEISLLNKDKEIQDANLLKGRYLMWLLIVLLAAMVLVVVLLVRNNRLQASNNAQILAQHQQITSQNAALVSQNEQLEQLNREMEGMVHVVAHDLKAPLSQLGGLIDGMAEAGELNAQQTKLSQLAQRVTRSASGLVNDLVESAGQGQQAVPLQLRDTDVRALVQDVAQAFELEARRKEIALQLRLPETPTHCMTQPEYLQRILENLLSNALKFSLPRTAVAVTLELEAAHVRLSVQDQGPGISASDQKLMFQKFARLSARPTGGESSSGLGLAIVKLLVEQLGGNIALHSEVGKGSTFVVRLPHAAA